jgi:multiple sugar transport system substrate-binding protein
MKQKLSLVLCLVLLSALFSFSVAAQDEPITIVYWTHNHAPSIPVNQAIIDEFLAENPNVTIIFDHAPHDNYEQRVLTAFAGQQGPDVFWAGDWMVPQFLRNNMIAPVDPTAFGVETQEEFLALFAPGSLDAFIGEDGLVYTGGVSEYNTFSLIYNLDHFTEAGLEPLSETEPLTWEEFMDIGEQLAQSEAGATTRVALTWPFQTPIWTVLITEPMVRQLGGEIVDPETGMPQFNTPEMIRVMSMIAEMQDRGVIDSAFYSDVLLDFAAERTSTVIAGPWAAQPLKDMNPDINWAVAPLPQFEDAVDRVTTLYAWAWYVNANIPEERQHVAWRLVERLTAAQEEWWDSVGYVQARLGETQDGRTFEEFRAQSDERLQVIFNDYQFGQYQFRSTAYFEVSDILTRAQTRILAGGNVESVLRDAQTAAEFSAN